MSNVLTKDFLTNLQAGTYIDGLILIRNYSIQLTKNGKEYATGVLQSGIQIGFKAWNNSSAFSKLKNEEYTAQVCRITGTAEEYQGVVSITLNDVQAVQWDDMSVFLEERYPTDAYWNALKGLFCSKASEKISAIANTVLFENELVASRFKLEFAAQTHHDNCKSGLLAHTYKVVVNVINILTTYPTLASTQDEKDLILFGALVHDIGKIAEMKLGVYQKASVVTHRYLGIEFLDKDAIVSAYNEDWWYELVSIMLQHHGEFDDKCRSVAAYVVHCADILDSRLTDLVQAMEKPLLRDGTPTVKVDGYSLQLHQEG